MRITILSTALCVALSLVCFSAEAQARTERERRSDLMLLLNAHEFRVDAKLLRRVGPDVNKLLIEASGNPGLRPRVRNHAVMALSVFPSEQTRKYLDSLLMEPSLKGTPTGTLIRRQALRSLGKGFGDVVVVPISNLKDDPDPQIRIAVAQLSNTRETRSGGTGYLSRGLRSAPCNPSTMLPPPVLGQIKFQSRRLQFLYINNTIFLLKYSHI